LLTHAFFKALLFLGSGAVIHALAGEQDLRHMGGLKKELPVTYWTFLIGALAIAGVPGLAGFFSKDEILYRTFSGGHLVLWAVGAITSLMTAFYMFRLVFLAFHGERRTNAEAVARGAASHGSAVHDHQSDAESPPMHHTAHLHDAPRSMAIALIVLAVGSVFAGYLNVPPAIGGSAFLEHFLEPSLHVPAIGQPSAGHPNAGAALGTPPAAALGAPAAGAHAAADHTVEVMLMFLSSLIALAGIGLAAFLYLKRPQMPDRFTARFPGAYQFLVNKGYIDEVYDAVVVQPIKALSEHVLWKGDARVIDGAVNGTGQIVMETGALARQIQTGSVRTYAVFVLFGAVAIVGYYLWS
jgi:NADH-quinone oxidoreductase subunit L